VQAFAQRAAGSWGAVALKQRVSRRRSLVLISYQKRDARVTHDPRYSDIGPSLTFAIIAAPRSNIRIVNTTKSRHRHMRRSLFRIKRDRRNEFLSASSTCRVSAFIGAERPRSGNEIQSRFGDVSIGTSIKRPLSAGIGHCAQGLVIRRSRLRFTSKT
jgi:hypothetical protein